MDELASSLTVSSYAREYRDAPGVALKRLRSLWQDHKGSVVLETSQLCIRLGALATSFRGMAGYGNEPGGKIPDVFPKPEGTLWQACISAEMPVLLLDMIQNKHFTKQPFVRISSALLV